MFFIDLIVLTAVGTFKFMTTFNQLRKSRENIRGKLVLITGAGSGFGKELAVKLSQLGCKIAVVDINESASKKVAMELDKSAIVAKSFTADVSDKNDVEKLKSDVTKEMGQVDILISNAGLIQNQSEDVVEDAFLRKMIDVNVYGTILVLFVFAEKLD